MKSKKYRKTFNNTVKVFTEYIGIYQENINDDSFESEEKIYQYLRNIENNLSVINNEYPGLYEVLKDAPLHRKIIKHSQVSFLAWLVIRTNTNVRRLLKENNCGPYLDFYTLATLTEETLKKYGGKAYELGQLSGYIYQPLNKKVESILHLLCSDKVYWVFGDLNLHIMPPKKTGAT